MSETMPSSEEPKQPEAQEPAAEPAVSGDASPSPTSSSPAAEAGSPEAPKSPSIFSRIVAFGGELLHVVIISLAIIIPVRYFLIQPFYVKGASMEPNFNDHEYLIIDEIGYRMHDPVRGDIVVFRYPNDPRQFFIKRIIGLPGERVKVGDGKITIFNQQNPAGKALDETSYLGALATSGDRDTKLGPNEYFLMGDNRPASLDSRVFGAVPKEFIVGRVWLRGWPPEKMKVFSDSPVALP
jgi:signal peptidase I